MLTELYVSHSFSLYALKDLVEIQVCMPSLIVLHSSVEMACKVPCILFELLLFWPICTWLRLNVFGLPSHV